MSAFIYIVIIIAWIAIARSSKKKKKPQSKKNTSQYDPIYPESEPESRRPAKSDEKNRRINRPKATVTEFKSEKTAISERVEKQHDEYDRSRIHQNVHKDEMREEQNGVPMMEKVRDLIVCGYPVEIPGQRDFVKEGEDFLANLGAHNTFF